LTDEKTGFLSGAATRTKTAESIVDSVHQVDRSGLNVRRWWTDCAPEFKKDLAIIRAQRPLAHYTGIPFRLQPNWIVERSNRVLVEGTRLILIQSGLPATWWPLALLFRIVCHNANDKDNDGCTAWMRRFGEDPRFKLYPFGAVMLYKPPYVKGGEISKWQSRLMPAVLVGTDLGPACDWMRTYFVIKLVQLPGDLRPSKATIRRV
jgi:hypothetical protein